MVLKPSTTLSINVPGDLNFLRLMSRIHHGSLRVGYLEEFRWYAARIMGYPNSGIWVITYRAISITSSYEFFMWKLMSLHDGEGLPAVVN